MKRLFAAALIISMMMSFAAAEGIDLSGLSFAELAELRDRCQSEMMTRDQWQEVTVPQGVWEVGSQIPPGKWVVKCFDSARDDYLLKECWLFVGKGKPNYNGFYWSGEEEKYDMEIYNPNSYRYSGGLTEYVIELEVGEYVSIHPQYNKAVFSPYMGINLGFK